jgi:hypothetical protein
VIDISTKCKQKNQYEEYLIILNGG